MIFLVLQEKYSDMIVRLSSRDIRAHRFVLAARSDNWGVSTLAEVDSLGEGPAMLHDKTVDKT